VALRSATNTSHHMYTNVARQDGRLGFGIMRITRDERWKPAHRLDPLRNLLLQGIFEWGIAPLQRACTDGATKRAYGRPLESAASKAMKAKIAA